MKEKFKLQHGFVLVLVLTALMVLSGCYQHGARNYRLPRAFHVSERLIDSLSFFSTHHYTNNYNFVVKADSLPLIRQLPEETLTSVLFRPTASTPCGCNWPTIRRPLGGAERAICCRK